MDTFMCSSWYHLRYMSPKYDQGPFVTEDYNYWMPVDTYTGGIEHATMHLIYTRFFHKACRDMGITRGPEPMLQLRNQGIILGEDSGKEANSSGNVIAPVGAQAPRALTRSTHQTIRRVTRDFERFEFNTIISALMEFTNLLYKYRETSLYGSPEWEQAIDSLLLLAAPVAVHMAEGLWGRGKGA